MSRTGGARWISWLFGLSLLAGVALFASHQDEGRQFARLAVHARPGWLLLGLFLQAATYVAEAGIWQGIIRRAGLSRPLGPYMGLSLAKLFMDQVVPSGGLSGTLLVVRALDRRGVPRGGSMAAIVVDLVSYYGAYVVGLVIALGVVWIHGDLTLFVILPAALFAPVAAGIPLALFWMSRGRRLPGWITRLPVVGTALRTLAEATPGIAHDVPLIARCTVFQAAIVLLDAGTLWAMLRSLGLSVHPA